MNSLRPTPRVLHVITDLRRGGAELALARLTTQLHQSGLCNEQVVVSLMSRGDVVFDLEDEGVKIVSLNAKGFLDVPRVVLALRQVMRAAKPTAVFTWLYHADLLGTIARNTLLGMRPPIVWNLRGSASPGGNHPRLKMLLLGILATVSPYQTAITYNADVVLTSHMRQGYRTRNWIYVEPVAPIDRHAVPSDLTPLRDATRGALGIHDRDFLVMTAANYRREKNYDSFLRICELITSERDDVFFLALGLGVSKVRIPSKLQCRLSVIESVVDLTPYLVASDLHVLTARNGEGVPNVVIEAGLQGLMTMGFDTWLLPQSHDYLVEHVPAESNDDAFAKRVIELLDESPEVKSVRRSRARQAALEIAEKSRKLEGWKNVFQILESRYQ